MVACGYLQIPIRVLIADVYPVVRTGLITTIEADAHMQVVGTATCRHDLMTQLQTTNVDVLVINLIDMGDAPIAVLREIKQFHASLGVVVFAARADFAPELLAAGVYGYLSYEEPDQQLHLAIRAAKARQHFLSPLVQDYIDRCAMLTVKHRFVPRELQIIKYIAQGLDTKEIAKRLDLTYWTTRNYVSSIRKKTGWTTWPQMVSWYNAMYGGDGSRSHLLSGRT